ncbi:MAG: DciA family protein [Planctomycetota bacterium]|nr:DciA family protein [Planctomycetota bacterium]MDA1221786.1 DciA family protein [Planctomycetota bacterium]
MTDPKHAATFLKGVLSEVGTKASRVRFKDALEHAVGERTAKHLEVVGFRGGRLYVAVDSAPLYAEMIGFRRDSIRKACNEFLAPEQIGEIVFRMGGTAHV